MDTKAYIESGILELYVLGKLSEAERGEVEAFAQKHAEVRAELDAIEAALEQYALLHAQAPSEGLLERIQSKIRAEGQPPKASPSAFSWIVLAALLFGIAALAWSVFSYQQAGRLAAERNEAQAELRMLREDCAAQEAQLERLRQQNAIVREKGNRTIYMQGTPLAAESLVAVHWNPAQNKIYLDLIELPEAPAGKQYQLWAIVAGQPVDMGLLEQALRPGAFVEIPGLAESDPQAFAITLEPAGGSPAPTLDAMYVIGYVPAG